MGLHEDQHLIIQDVLRVSREVLGGRVPKRDEYLSSGATFTRTDIERAFSSWTLLLQASGLKYDVRKKIDKEENRKRAFEHLKKEIEERKQIITRDFPPAQRLLFISDLHVPYEHQDAFDFVKELNSKYSFDRITCAGDEVDMHAISFHDSDPDLFSAGHELEEAIRHLEKWYKLFPDMDIMESNHGSLVYRKAKHHGLPRRVLKTYQEILSAPPGWHWHDELVVDLCDNRKVILHHSIAGNVLAVSKNRSMSHMAGHIHSKFSMEYWANPLDIYFAVQSGCLIDDTSYAMAYNKPAKDRPIIGCSGIIDGQPKLFPMILGPNGRWTGFVP